MWTVRILLVGLLLLAALLSACSVRYNPVPWTGNEGDCSGLVRGK